MRILSEWLLTKAKKLLSTGGILLTEGATGRNEEGLAQEGAGEMRVLEREPGIRKQGSVVNLEIKVLHEDIIIS